MKSSICEIKYNSEETFLLNRFEHYLRNNYHPSAALTNAHQELAVFKAGIQPKDSESRIKELESEIAELKSRPSALPTELTEGQMDSILDECRRLYDYEVNKVYRALLKVLGPIVATEFVNITHQKQPTPTSCVAACVAMVAGLDVDTVLREFPDPVGGEGLRKMLGRYGVKWRFDGLGGNLEPGKCYIAVVPSLNLKGSNHQVVIDVRDGGKVYDPNEGRDGKFYYTYPESKDPLAFTLHTWTDLIEVEPRARRLDAEEAAASKKEGV